MFNFRIIMINKKKKYYDLNFKLFTFKLYICYLETQIFTILNLFSDNLQNIY